MLTPPNRTRRNLIVAAALSGVAAPFARARAADRFAAFLNGVRAEARKAGISPTTLDAAFHGISVNQKVLERDRHQPEFTMTWERYKGIVINDQRIVNGRDAYRQNRPLLGQVQDRFGVDPRIVLGIWGLESGFGASTGNFHVIEALATLAWEGRRASFFRSELMAALKILQAGDITPARMTGSYAGAMGQPQFMPTSYLRYAVDFNGDGKRDIWTNRADALGSVANYLARSGWKSGEIWGTRATIPASFDPSLGGREHKRDRSDWARLGVRPSDGQSWPGPGSAALVLPEGPDGDVFLVGANFTAIRRYNPSDFYALGVGLLGDMVAA